MSSKLVRVAFATDNGYARALAVAGGSVIRHLEKDRSLELYVLDMGISKLNRRKIEESFAGPRVKVSWITGRQEAVSGLPPGGPWITRSTYARLLLPDVMRRRLTLTGSTLRPRSVEFKTMVADEIAQTVWPFVEGGRLRPVIDSSFPLGEAAAAHARMDAPDHVGKTVLTVD